MSAPKKVVTVQLPKVLEQYNLDMNNKVVAITGTTSGTGFVAALELARRGAIVLLLNRESSRVESMLDAFKREVPDGIFYQITCDLQNFQSVMKCAEAIKSKVKVIDVLINNAGIMAMPDKATADGYDVQMQTNVLSHFLLTKELLPLIKRSTYKRVVQHSSMARLGSNLALKYFEPRGGDLGGDGTLDEAKQFQGPKWERYHQTKLANAVFTYALKNRLEDAGIKDVLSLLAHPGLAATSLMDGPASSDGMVNGDALTAFMATGQTAADGACGILRAALDPNSKSGDFYGPGGEGPDAWKKGFPESLAPEPLLYDPENEKVFWEGCSKAVGDFDVKA